MFSRSTIAASVLGALATLGSAEASLSPRTSKQCQSNYFWYDRLNCCLKNGGESTTSPSGSSCPSNFYWHTTEKCCVPKSSNTVQQVPSGCPNGYSWNILTWSCKSSTPSATTCGTGFWWQALGSCVSLGNTGSSVPSGYSCPSNWSWLSSKSCCKPNLPTAPSTPSCGNSWLWHPGKQCCIPGDSAPTPSNAPGTYGRKRHATVQKRTNFCPNTHESCPIPGSKRSSEQECLDTRSELTSCGGCVSLGQGQDCSAIPNAKVSTCQTGRCVVQKCKPGYQVGSAGDACVSAPRAML